MHLLRLGRARALALVLGVVLLVGSVVVGPFAWVIGQNAWSHWRRCRGYTRFNAGPWQDPALAEGLRAIRGCMVDDLLARDPLQGKSRAAVLALLGRPRPTDYFRDWDLVYWLGPERGLIGIDSEWLVIRFDAAGRVSQARLVTD